METSQQERPEPLKNLKEIREIAGINQRQLAQLVHIAHGTVRAIETGHKKFSTPLVEKIAHRLGCDMIPAERGKPAELTLTQMGTSERYTREWFEYWNEVCLRKEVYNDFLMHYKARVSCLIEAACELDVTKEKQGKDAFDASLSLVTQLIENLYKVEEDERLSETLAQAERRLPYHLQRSMPHPWEVSHLHLNDLLDAYQKSVSDLEKRK